MAIFIYRIAGNFRMVLIFVCSIPYTKIKLRKFEHTKFFSFSRVTFDLYTRHTRSLAGGAKCKASSLNDGSLSILCQGVETKWPFWFQWTAIGIDYDQWCSYAARKWERYQLRMRTISIYINTILRVFWPIIRKLAPTKISRYTVAACIYSCTW